MEVTHQGIVPWRKILPVFCILLCFPLIAGILLEPRAEGFLFRTCDVCSRLFWEVSGFFVGVFGLTIRMLANGYDQKTNRKPHRSKGLYSIVRYPLLVGNFFLGLAPVMLLNDSWAFIVYAGLFAIYCASIVVRDKRRLGACDDTVYRAWFETTPAFVPRSFRWNRPDGVFSFQQILRREYVLFLGLILSMTAADHVSDCLVREIFRFDYNWLPVLTLAVGCSLAVYSLFGLSLVVLCAIFFITGFGKTVKAQSVDSWQPANTLLTKPPKKRISLGNLFFPDSFLSLPRLEAKRETPGRLFDRALREHVPTNNFRTSLPTSFGFGNGNASLVRNGILRRECDPCGPSERDRLFRLPPVQDRPNCFLISGRVASGTKKRLFSDMKNFYDRDNALNFSVVLAGSAILANSKLDRDFQRWYQGNVRTSSTDDFAATSKIFGEGQYFIPVAVSSALLYRWCQERSGNREGNPFGDFVSRTARGYAIGAPALLIGQYALGGDRPSSGSSRWRPFQETHGISGHAFIGATPFITAAHMSENPWAKGIFYTLSVLPAWSRVNDDSHYLSQAVLGWYLSYLSVRAVSETEGVRPLPKGLTIFPVVEDKAFGIGFLYRY